MLRGPNVMTAAKRYFEDNAHIKATTRKNWMQTFAMRQRRYPDKRVNELTSDDLRDFLLKDEYGQPTKLARGTIVSRRTTLRSFFSWCEYAGILQSDPASTLVRTVRLRPDPRRAHIWMSGEEISALFGVCRADEVPLRGKRDAILLGFGLYCGLRRHEIAKVTWGDLNLRAKTLSVLGKGAKLATVPVPAQLVEMLFEWQGLMAQGQGAPPARDQRVLCRFMAPGGPLFGGTPRHLSPRWDKGISGDTVYDVVQHRGREIGVPELTPHDLRRSYAGILEDRGVELRAISAVLRHSSISTTERYLGDNPKKWQDSVASALSGLGEQSA